MEFVPILVTYLTYLLTQNFLVFLRLDHHEKRWWMIARGKGEVGGRQKSIVTERAAVGDLSFASSSFLRWDS